MKIQLTYREICFSGTFNCILNQISVINLMTLMKKVIWGWDNHGRIFIFVTNVWINVPGSLKRMTFLMCVPSSAPFLMIGDTFRPNPDVSTGVRLLPSWTDQAKLFFNIYRGQNIFFKYMEACFSHRIKKKGNCYFLSRSSDFFSCNCEI